MLPRQFHQLLAQLRVVIRPRFVSIAAAIHIDELAGLALGHLVVLDGERHVRPQAGKLHPFFRTMPFSASLSRLRSATNCFSRRFSSSSALGRGASLTSIPPYFDFQV